MYEQVADYEPTLELFLNNVSGWDLRWGGHGCYRHGARYKRHDLIRFTDSDSDGRSACDGTATAVDPGESESLVLNLYESGGGGVIV